MYVTRVRRARASFCPSSSVLKRTTVVTTTTKMMMTSIERVYEIRIQMKLSRYRFKRCHLVKFFPENSWHKHTEFPDDECTTSTPSSNNMVNWHISEDIHLEHNLAPECIERKRYTALHWHYDWLTMAMPVSDVDECLDFDAVRVDYIILIGVRLKISWCGQILVWFVWHQYWCRSRCKIFSL